MELGALFGSAVAGVILTLIVMRFLPGYLFQKGRNVATKEDIGELTKIFENIKTDAAKQLQDGARQHQGA